MKTNNIFENRNFRRVNNLCAGSVWDYYNSNVATDLRKEILYVDTDIVIVYSENNGLSLTQPEEQVLTLSEFKKYIIENELTIKG